MLYGMGHLTKRSRVILRLNYFYTKKEYVSFGTMGAFFLIREVFFEIFHYLCTQNDIYKLKFYLQETMRKLKRLLLLCLALFLCTGVMANETAEALRLQLSNGQTVTYLLEEKPEVTFKAESLCVSTATASVEYGLSEIAGFDFTTVETGIENVKGNEVLFRAIGNSQWVIEGKQTTAVRVADISGRQLPGCVSNSAAGTIVSLSAAPSGIYVISFSNHSVKIVKK